MWNVFRIISYVEINTNRKRRPNRIWDRWHEMNKGKSLPTRFRKWVSLTQHYRGYFTILDASDHTNTITEIREGVSGAILGPQAYVAVLFRNCSHSHENYILQPKCANFLPDIIQGAGNIENFPTMKVFNLLPLLVTVWCLMACLLQGHLLQLLTRGCLLSSTLFLTLF